MAGGWDASGGGLPMRSLWSDTDAERMVERYAQQGVGRDVALRVYGTADDVDALWRANRDALPRPDSPLSPGTLLRTPTVR